MSLSEKIREIEEEIRKTQKNKATEHHIGLLKAKLAKLKREIISGSKSGGGGGFAVRKSGHATVALVGFPSVGKSTLLKTLTNVKSKAAAYAFTTLTCIPGIMEYKGAKIQILDLPGIVEGACSGRGRGREVIAVARNSDLILIVVDACVPQQYQKIIRELEGVGIRLNKQKPNIRVEKTIRGGITIFRRGETPDLDDKTVHAILHEYSIHNANVILPKNATADDLIDTLEGNRVYLKSVVVANKIDICPNPALPVDFIPISCSLNKNIDLLKKTLYQTLSFIRVYTKRKGEEVDDEPLVLKKGACVVDVCRALHRDLEKNFKYAKVWGTSVKHPGQRVGKTHRLEDGDVVQIFAK